MNPLVVHVVPQCGHRLLIEFANGEKRLFDLTPYLDQGVFCARREWSEFSKVSVVDGSIEWPGEIDLSDDTVYLRGVTAESTAA